MKLEYQRTIIGYHGCDASLVDELLAGKSNLEVSINPDDWIGQGIYFWKHGPARALDWAKERASMFGRIKHPSVVGALIHLGVCFDLLDTHYTQVLRDLWPLIAESFRSKHPDKKLPANKGPRRFLDCAVVDEVLPIWEQEHHVKFQSVRCVFTEGDAVCEGSGIMMKSHIQIAIRDPSCILGYFRPAQL